MLQIAQQEVVVERPPNFAEILKTFPNAGNKGVIFSYGNIIYNPSAVHIPRELFAHEGVHGLRQSIAGVEKWWERYIAEPLFRLDEEIYAHHEEYKAALRRHGPRPRNLRRIAERLCGPLYGNLLTLGQAQHAILTGELK